VKIPTLLLLVTMAALTQAGQQSRPIPRDARGLLRVDPTMYGLSAATGGDFYMWSEGEFASSRLEIPIHGESVLLSYGSLGELPSRFELPVESFVKELVVFAAAQRKDLAVLVDPDGNVVRSGSPGARLQQYQHMLIANVQNPKAGMWRLEFTGSGVTSVHASVRSASERFVELVAFDFVEPGGRPGHEGYFPMKKEPVAGQRVLARVNIGGAPREARLSFITADGKLIGREVELMLHEDEALTSVTIPRGVYRVRVSGRNSAGQVFQRVESRSRGLAN
jgi:hypothetical protein